MGGIVKTGRTHLMDAMPRDARSGELGGWRAQIEHGIARLAGRASRGCMALAQGGTAVGTGINAHPEFGARVRGAAAQRPTSVSIRADGNLFEALSSAGHGRRTVRAAATRSPSALMKIANDLRWMNSGPLAGLARDRAAGAAARQQHHARQGESGDSGGGRDGRRAGDRQRRDDHHRRPVGQLPAQRHAAADRQQPAREHPAAGERRARAGRPMPSPGSSRIIARLDEALARNPILATALNPVIGYEKRRGDRQARLCRRAAGVRRGARDVGPEGRRTAPPARSGDADARRTARRRRPG